NPRFNLEGGHHFRPPAVRTTQTFRGAEQAANQWAFIVRTAAVFCEMDTAPLGQRFVALGVAFDGKPCHLLGRGHHRATAIVAARDAFERRNAPPVKAYRLAVCAHRWSRTVTTETVPMLCSPRRRYALQRVRKSARIGPIASKARPAANGIVAA